MSIRDGGPPSGWLYIGLGVPMTALSVFMTLQRPIGGLALIASLVMLTYGVLLLIREARARRKPNVDQTH